MKAVLIGVIGLSVFLASWLGFSEQKKVEPKQEKEQKKEKVAIDVIQDVPVLFQNNSEVFSCISRVEQLDGIRRQSFDNNWSSDDARLGIHIRQPSRTLRKHLKLGPMMGLVVQAVRKGSAAERAGIQVDDVLVAFDDQKLLNEDQLSGLVMNQKVGDKVDVQLISEGDAKKVVVNIPKPNLPKIKRAKDPHVPVLRTLKHPKIVASARCGDCHISAGEVKTVSDFKKATYKN